MRDCAFVIAALFAACSLAGCLVEAPPEVAFMSVGGDGNVSYDSASADGGSADGSASADSDDGGDGDASAPIDLVVPADADQSDAGTVDSWPVDAGPVDSGPVDSGPVDSGPVDAGPVDSGPVDSGPVDSGPVDSGPVDSGPVDSGPVDSGPVDSGPVDSGPVDSGPVDAGPVDTGPVDTGPVDSGPVDSGPVDSGPVDSGPVDSGPVDSGPVDSGPVDAGPVDTGPVDSGPVDSGPVDAGPPPCVPVAEICYNGLDDDCDGKIDAYDNDGTLGGKKSNCIGMPVQLLDFWSKDGGTARILFPNGQIYDSVVSKDTTKKWDFLSTDLPALIVFVGKGDIAVSSVGSASFEWWKQGFKPVPKPLQPPKAGTWTDYVEYAASATSYVTIKITGYK